MTLLTITQNALKEIGEFAVPASIVGNTDPTAVQLLALANRTGRSLAKDYDWQVLVKTHTFNTAGGTADYALPADFRSFANLTQWDRANDRRMEGPVSKVIWEAMQSGQSFAAGITKYFRVAANLFSIYPTPTATEGIAYQYFSDYWVDTDADGDGDADGFAADANTTLIDEDLMTLGVRWRFLAAKGASYAPVLIEYEERRDAILGRDGGRNMIRFGGPSGPIFADNIPETGIG